MHRTPPLLGALLAALAALTACSSHDRGANPASTSGQAAASSASSLPSPAMTAGSAGSAGSAGTPRADDSAGAGAFCTELGLADDPSALTSDPAAYKAKLEQIVADAPPEIRDDLAAFAQVAGEMADDSPGAAQEFEQPGVLQKVQHFVTWLHAHCPGADVPTTSRS